MKILFGSNFYDGFLETYVCINLIQSEDNTKEGTLSTSHEKNCGPFVSQKKRQQNVGAKLVLLSDFDLFLIKIDPINSIL